MLSFGLNPFYYRSITNVIHQSPTVLTGSGMRCEAPALTEDNQHLHIVPVGVDPAEDPLGETYFVTF